MTEITTITRHNDETTTKTQYRCDKCLTLYDTEEEANYCERTTHDNPVFGKPYASEYMGPERHPLYLYLPFIKGGEVNYNFQLYKHVSFDSISEENAERIAKHYGRLDPVIDPPSGEDGEHEVVPGNPTDPNDLQGANDEGNGDDNNGNNDSGNTNVDPIDPNAPPEGAGGNENTDNTGGDVEPVNDPNANTVDDVDPLNTPGTDPTSAVEGVGDNEGSQGNSGSSVDPIDGGYTDPGAEEIDPNTNPSAATEGSGSDEGSNQVEPIDVGGNNDPDPEEIDP